jgi:hypothetical protein
MEARVIEWTCGCGKKCRSVCTQQWQIDHVERSKRGKTCDGCLIAVNPYPGKGDRGDAQAEFESSSKELHEQEKADELCRSM